MQACGAPDLLQKGVNGHHISPEFFGVLEAQVSQNGRSLRA